MALPPTYLHGFLDFRGADALVDVPSDDDPDAGGPLLIPGHFVSRVFPSSPSRPSLSLSLSASISCSLSFLWPRIFSSSDAVAAGPVSALFGYTTFGPGELTFFRQ